MFISDKCLGMLRIGGRTRRFNFFSKVGLDLWKWRRVKERSGIETDFTKNLDQNDLVTKLLKQCCVPYFSLLGAILYFVVKKTCRKNVKFHLTLHWLELANQWLELTQEFCDSSQPSHDPILIRVEKILVDLDSKSLRLWLDKFDSGTSLGDSFELFYTANNFN